GGRQGLTSYNTVFRRTRSSGTCAAPFVEVTPTGTPPAALAFAQATWDQQNKRFFVGGGTGMSSIWLLEFGAAGDPNSSTPSWRELTAASVVGPWYSPSSTSRMAWDGTRLVLAHPNGAIFVFYPEG